VRFADIICSKSVRITSRQPQIFIPNHIFSFSSENENISHSACRIFHTRSVFHIFAEAKIFHIRQSRIYMPRPMGEVSAHECADDGEGIFPPYCVAVVTPHQSHSRQLPLKGKPWFTVRLHANLHLLWKMIMWIGNKISRTAVVKPNAFRTDYVSKPHVIFFLYFCCGATKIKIQPRR